MLLSGANDEPLRVSDAIIRDFCDIAGWKVGLSTCTDFLTRLKFSKIFLSAIFKVY